MRLPIALTMTLALAPAPALAADEPWRVAQSPPPTVSLKPQKEPWLGVGLSVGAPIAIGLAGLALSQANPGWTLDGRWNAVDATLVAVPLGLSAGYFYAGEPGDGLLVGLFGSAAMAAGTYFSRGGTLSGTVDPAAASVWPLVIASGLAVAAGAFAVSDVRDLITQKNKEK